MSSLIKKTNRGLTKDLPEEKPGSRKYIKQNIFVLKMMK